METPGFYLSFIVVLVVVKPGSNSQQQTLSSRRKKDTALPKACQFKVKRRAGLLSGD
jgi:hypothetical protein